MKRKYKPEPDFVVSKTFPLLFWVRCLKCGEEFRREQGWKTELWIKGMLGYLLPKHLCKDCAPDYKSANQYFLDWLDWKQGKGIAKRNIIIYGTTQQ